MEETIYVVEEDEDEEETVRVGFKLWRTDAKIAKTSADNTQEIGDAFCQRYDFQASYSLPRTVFDIPQETVSSSSPLKHHHEIRIPKNNHGNTLGTPVWTMGRWKIPKRHIAEHSRMGQEASCQMH